MKQVTVVQRRMTHYRVPFFEALRSAMMNRGIALTLAYGEGTEAEREKGDAAEIDWGTRLSTRYWMAGRICWQPMAAVTANSEMLVVTPENKLVLNLIYQYIPSTMRIGLWGHGANLQGDANSLRERFKRRVARRTDWWFGYTEMSLPLIARSGFPLDRVTVLNNSIDTHAMREQFLSVSGADRLAWRQVKGIFRQALVGIFVGSLYAEKRLDFLFSSAFLLRELEPSFELLILGDGPERGKVEALARQYSWIRYLGVQNGLEKVKALASSDIMLNPGLVGLGILDSFVCQVPMVTTDCGLHSPEIAYLEPGVNGEMIANDEKSYVAAVHALLHDPFRRCQLQQGCGRSAERYTVDNMAANFAHGVEQCLAVPIFRNKPRKQ